MDDEPDTRRDLSPAARRALAEARARNEKAQNAQLPTEIAGTNGPEPTRYGDWEKDGITSDF